MSGVKLGGIPVPDGATYGSYRIIEILYNEDAERLSVIFKGEDLYDEWNQLVFTNCRLSGRRLTVDRSGIPVGLVRPGECTDQDTPGANEAEELYSVLTEAGIKVRGFN